MEFNFDRIEKIVKKGTTTVGIVCKDGVVLAADRQATLGTTIASKRTIKIFPIDDHLAMTTSGIAGDAERLARIMRSEAKLYKTERGYPMSVRAAGTLLANVLNSYRLYPFFTLLVLGGIDHRGPRIYSLDPLGSKGAEEEEYYATGSGSAIAYGVLEEGYRKDLTVEEGVKLAIRALNSAKKRDIYTGGVETGIDVAIVTEKGFERLSEEKIKELAA